MSSAFVDNSLIRKRIANSTGDTNGDRWLSIFASIPLTLDLRARQGVFSTPWQAPVDDLFKNPVTYTNQTLAEIYDRRALEVSTAAASTGRSIIIQWSGGVDSTALLASMIKNLNKNDLENITIYLSTTSIIENFNFYQKFIHGKIKTANWLDLDVNDELLDSHMILHGDPANCLFGPSGSMYAKLIADRNHLDTWKNQYSAICDSINAVLPESSTATGKWHADRISTSIIDGVDTVADWWWWHYFNFKWYSSIVRPLVWCRSDIKKPIKRSNFEFYVKNSFYANQDFQNWSYSNLKKLVGVDPAKTFKLDAKQYIYDLDKDEIYKAKKKFQASAPTNQIAADYGLAPVVFDKDWIGYRWKETDVGETITSMLEEFKG